MQLLDVVSGEILGEEEDKSHLEWTKQIIVTCVGGRKYPIELVEVHISRRGQHSNKKLCSHT